MIVKVEGVGRLLLTDQGIATEPLEPFAMSAKAKYVLERVLRHNRGRFEQDCPGGDDRQFLEWLVERQPDIYPMSLVK
jgi:hypothetical protein